jgi:hypothetical protein
MSINRRTMKSIEIVMIDAATKRKTRLKIARTRGETKCQQKNRHISTVYVTKKKPRAPCSAMRIERLTNAAVQTKIESIDRVCSQEIKRVMNDKSDFTINKNCETKKKKKKKKNKEQRQKANNNNNKTNIIKSNRPRGIRIIFANRRSPTRVVAT